MPEVHGRRAHKKLNILLVEPVNPYVMTGSSGTPPLWQGILKQLTPEPHHVDFIHCAFEEVTPQVLSRYDLVGVTCRTDSAHSAYAIGEMCRTSSVPCVVGGIHASVMAEEAEPHFDSVSVGEAECFWEDIVSDAARGRLEQRYSCSHQEKHGFPVPDMSAAKKYGFGIINSIETVRGCPFNCSFCSATAYNGNKYRYKPTSEVIREVRGWDKSSRLALFADLNVVANQDKAKALFRALSHENLMWWGSADVKVADDEETLRLMSKAGCNYISIGIESLSSNTLKDINKAHNTRRDFKEVVKRVHEHNIDVFGNFIFGLDEDDDKVFERTVDFVIDTGIDFPVFQILVPYPGTKLFDRFDKEGRLVTKDWSKYTRSDVVFHPKNLSRGRLLEGTFWAFEEVYSKRNVAKRALARWRGVKRNVYNALILKHFTQTVREVEKYHSVGRSSLLQKTA